MPSTGEQSDPTTSEEQEVALGSEGAVEKEAVPPEAELLRTAVEEVFERADYARTYGDIVATAFAGERRGIFPGKKVVDKEERTISFVHLIGQNGASAWLERTIELESGRTNYDLNSKDLGQGEIDVGFDVLDGEVASADMTSGSRKVYDYGDIANWLRTANDGPIREDPALRRVKEENAMSEEEVQGAVAGKRLPKRIK